MLSCFSLIATDSHGTLHLALGLALSCFFFMVGNKVFIFIICSMYFKSLLKSIKLVFYSYHILISDILLLVSENQSYGEALTVYV